MPYSKQRSLSFTQLLAGEQAKASKHHPFICGEGVALASGVLTCQTPAGNRSGQRQERGALILSMRTASTVIGFI